MCSMSLTVTVSARSNWEMMRPSISSVERPVYRQITLMTVMLILGKMSVGVPGVIGVRKIISGLMIRMSSASTMNGYGRRSASWTIHIRCGRQTAAGTFGSAGGKRCDGCARPTVVAVRKRGREVARIRRARTRKHANASGVSEKHNDNRDVSGAERLAAEPGRGAPPLVRMRAASTMSARRAWRGRDYGTDEDKDAAADADSRW